MTHYVILKEDTHEDDVTAQIVSHWREFGTVAASSPRSALRARKADGGTYVAVPARSWKPLTVKSETVTKITIG